MADTSGAGANPPSEPPRPSLNSGGTNAEGSVEKSKKKARLHWDEDNLMLNALEMERTPRMKIDEPKTPFATGSGSEAGSSTSGSAPQSPGSPHPQPAFIPREQLKGFHSLETGIGSDPGSSSGSLSRSVHIAGLNASSNGSSPRTKEEFELKRKKHYHNEARLSRFASSELGRSAESYIDEDGTRESLGPFVGRRANGTTGRTGDGERENGIRDDGASD